MYFLIFLFFLYEIFIAIPRRFKIKQVLEEQKEEIEGIKAVKTLPPLVEEKPKYCKTINLDPDKIYEKCFGNKINHPL